MKVAHSVTEIGFQNNTVVTVGSFDGVHWGHQEIVRDVIQRAKSREGRSVIVTFDPHPREVLGNGPVQLLTTAEEREQIFRVLNPNILLVLKFTYEFSRQSFRDFYLNYFIHGVGVSEIVEGYDHHFGRDREGSIEELVKLGKEFGFSVVAVNPVSIEGDVVSSSKIRQDISEGNVEHARLLMGRFYSLTGTVVRGDGRGKELGYPTANLAPAHAIKLVPKDGIYFVAVRVGTMLFPGMASIGVRPTFHENGRRIIEANIFGFTGDVYGATLELQFLKRLRDELKFQSVDELVVQMRRDKEESLKLHQEFSALFH
jgi:riboflavin kinase/FMN adenylyltransferase